MSPCAGPLPNDDIELKILHCRIEDLLDVGLQPMYFVDKQDITRLKIGENRGEVSFQLDERSCRGAKSRAHFVRDNGRKRRFAKARRSIEEDVIECFPALARRLDSDFEVLLDVILPDVLDQPPGPQRQFKNEILFCLR